MSQRKRRDPERSDGKEPYRPRNTWRYENKHIPKIRKGRKPYKIERCVTNPEMIEDKIDRMCFGDGSWQRCGKSYQTFDRAMQGLKNIDWHAERFYKRLKFEYRIVRK